MALEVEVTTLVVQTVAVIVDVEVSVAEGWARSAREAVTAARVAAVSGAGGRLRCFRGRIARAISAS